MEDYLSVDDNLDLAVIQAVALLALVDYTGKSDFGGKLFRFQPCLVPMDCMANARIYSGAC